MQHAIPKLVLLRSMSLIQGSGAAEVVAVLQSSQIQGYCTVAASTFVFYDHISTVAREAAFIWGRKCSSVTVLFHLNRWTIFIWAALGLFNFISLTTASLTYSHLQIPTAFSAIRTYAVGGSKWGVALLVFLLNMVPVGTNAVVPCTILRTLTSGLVAIATRVCTIAADIVILLVTWSKTYALNRGDATKYGLRSSLGTTLLRDGEQCCSSHRSSRLI
ncbi:hypothetical protein OBBRIDRAFT_864607 [Obba rivulosa]|uniref:DUF6533 domain-containing protein n=1 Tax=Obba rivulosa TaxID=1052685 RepID=A0A8E2AHA7_9APHY|nr:hypothetical protein OBBRIDRAFT_864607 [Obba rivulosa]